MSVVDHLRDYVGRQHPDTLRIFRLARLEVHCATARLRAACSPTQRRRRRVVRAARDLKVHLASGSNLLPGWINIDSAAGADLQVDVRRLLPFSDGSVSYLFTEHFLDHLEYPNGIGRLLRECHRILSDGGVMRAIVHDAELLLDAYLRRDAEFFAQIGQPMEGADAGSMAAAVNHIFRFDGFHQFIYDYETLSRELTKAGFRQVRRSAFRQSAIPELNVDIGTPDRYLQSLYIEAVK